LSARGSKVLIGVLAVLVVVFAGVAGYLYMQYTELQAKNADLENTVANLENTKNNLQNKVQQLQTTINDLQSTVNLEKNIVLLDSTPVFVHRNGQWTTNLDIDHPGYLKIDVSSSGNLTIAIVLNYNGQFIRSYQERSESQGSFIYPVLPGKVTLYVINMFPDDVSAVIKVTLYY